MKTELISKIKSIIEKCGSFSLFEVDSANGICVNEVGNLVALVEHFNQSTIEVKVYNPSSFSSDEIDSYELFYDELSEDVLEEILWVVEMYEVEQEKTQKRIL